MIRKTVRKKRTLGSAQRKVLSYLATNGTWWPECGWTYDSASATDHVLRTLSVHGLAKRVNSIGSKLGTYEITSLGRETMKALAESAANHLNPRRARTWTGFSAAWMGLRTMVRLGRRLDDRLYPAWRAQPAFRTTRASSAPSRAGPGSRRRPCASAGVERRRLGCPPEYYDFNSCLRPSQKGQRLISY